MRQKKWYWSVSGAGFSEERGVRGGRSNRIFTIREKQYGKDIIAENSRTVKGTAL